MTITRLLSCNEPGEVGQDPEPDLLAFFRMKLAGKQAIGRDTGDKRHSVIRRRSNNRAIVGHHVVGMDKINVIAIADPFQEGRAFLFLQPIPAHMGYFQAIFRVKNHDLPGKEVQPFLWSEFFALGKQKLKAETDPEKWLFLLDRPPDDLHEP